MMANNGGKWRDIRDRISRALPVASAAGALVIEREILTRAPQDSGQLKRDMRIRTNADDKHAVSMVVVRDRSFYWRFLERGTSRQSAKPFVRPGYEAAKEDARQTAKASLRALVKKG
jgi:HK97 gp10 family phage protein